VEVNNIYLKGIDELVENYIQFFHYSNEQQSIISSLIEDMEIIKNKIGTITYNNTLSDIKKYDLISKELKLMESKNKKIEGVKNDLQQLLFKLDERSAIMADSIHENNNNITPESILIEIKNRIKNQL
jgi:hypothetical protein